VENEEGKQNKDVEEGTVQEADRGYCPRGGLAAEDLILVSDTPLTEVNPTTPSITAHTATDATLRLDAITPLDQDATSTEKRLHEVEKGTARTLFEATATLLI
jgi:hypothetical protein